MEYGVWKYGPGIEIWKYGNGYGNGDGDGDVEI